MARSVLVVGAGWSGLSAARKLCQSNANVRVQVLEASDRVGGRCHAVTLPVSGPVEMGATWFHGTVNNPVFEFAVQQGIISADAGAGVADGGDASSPATSPQPAAADGSRSPEQSEPSESHAPGPPGFRLELCRIHERQPLSGEAMAAAVEAMGEYAEVLEELHDGSQGTIGGALRAYADQVNGKDPAYMEAWATRERLQRAYDGFSSADMASVVFAREYEDLEGPNVPVPGGYQALAECLAATLPPGTIQFNSRVTRIDYSETHGPGVRITFEMADGKQEVHADAVIVTVSLGVLKASAGDLFVPPLPDAKLDAIGRMHIGFVNKVFIEWPLEGDASAGAAAAGVSSGAGNDANGTSAGAATAGDATAGSRKGRAVDGMRSQPANALQQLGISVDDDAALLAANGGALGAFAGTPAAPPLLVYCLMWPTTASAWGSAAAPRGSWPAGEEHPIAGPLPDWVAAMLPARDAVYESPTAADELPLWLRGLHSWRYGDGPEWIHAPAGGAGAAGPPPPLAAQRKRAAVLWVTGASALAVERLDEAQLAAHVKQLLAAFPAVPLPETATKSDAVRVYASRWGSDPLARGSYSYYGPHAGVEAVDALAMPLVGAAGGEPLVCFAGEATHQQHMGTVHGAWQTGEREASRLLTAWAAVSVAP